MSSELAVIIVSWNTKQLTLNAIQSLFDDLNQHGPEADVWVVDNASTDASAAAIKAAFPQVRLITSSTNLGFSGGNNYALRAMGFSDQPGKAVNRDGLPRAVYLLNSDTITQPGATRTLYDALFTLPHAGVVGAQLSYGDGTFQHGAFHFPGLGQLIVELLPVPGRLYESAFNGRYPQAAYESGTPFQVDHTLGATMMLRQEVIQQTGIFDERYFMYCEEIDWSIRIRNAEWEIYTIPKARVIHLAGQSTQQIRAQSFVNLWRSRFRLFNLYYSPQKRFLARAIVRLGMHRLVRRAHADLASGNLTDDQHAALIDAYRIVQTL